MRIGCIQADCGPKKAPINVTLYSENAKTVSSQKRRPQAATLSRRWRHSATISLLILKRNETFVLGVLFLITFLTYFYASDLKGIWNDDAVRLTIANGGIATQDVTDRHPGTFKQVIKANGAYATQPAYLLLVNGILRLTRSYSVIPIVTTNLVIFLFSAVGIHLLARRLLAVGPRFLAMLLYLGNGFAMVHVLQVREYPLILFFLVWNTAFYYWLMETPSTGRSSAFWITALAYCFSAAATFYTTKWAPFFLWPQAAIALLDLRRRVYAAWTVLISLVVAGLLCLPWVLSIPSNSKVFIKWDNRPATLQLLLARLYGGTEHLLIGSASAGHFLLHVYYWVVLVLLTLGLFIFVCRFFKERFEIQHLVLTIVGFVTFQIAYFFLREPLSTWPRYFILYLPFVALVIPLTLTRLFSLAVKKMASHARVYVVTLVMTASAGFAQLKGNYEFPYVDHGPDFREVYEYLISRVAPLDLMLVGLPTNRMALNYYWPLARQVHLGYKLTSSEVMADRTRIWTVSYKDQDSSSYKALAEKLGQNGFRLDNEKIIAHVTIRQFERSK